MIGERSVGRELDAEIALATGFVRERVGDTFYGNKDYSCMVLERGYYDHEGSAPELPYYTTRIEAALTLAPTREWGASALSSIGLGGNAALVICIAALKARLSECVERLDAITAHAELEEQAAYVSFPNQPLRGERMYGLKDIADILTRAEVAEAALREISAIENQDNGPDWEEIEEARNIARSALATQEPRHD